MTNQADIAPPLEVSEWLNTAAPISLAALRGRVVLLHAFQMLCPACVSHGLPQASRIHALFDRKDLVVIGLHTVFEHHAVMHADALRAFVHEYRLAFPIGIDQAGEAGGVPRTMHAYALRGTPSTVLLDRQGRVRLHHFGHLDDLQMGSMLGRLVSDETAPADATPPQGLPADTDCGAGACEIGPRN